MKTGWELIRLDDLCSIARGGSPRPIKDFITDDPEGVNWIKIGDTELGGRYISSTKQKIKKEGIARSRFVNEGDFLLSNSMSFGRPYILEISGCIHDGWLVLEPDYNRVDQGFLYYSLGSNVVFEQFDKLAAGSTVRNLNKDLVAKVVIYLPPLDEQKRIVAILDAAFDGLARARANVEANLQNARELFESGLDTAFDANNNEWELKNFGDEVFLKIVDGDRGSHYPKKSDFQESGYCLFLNTKNVRPNGFDFETCMFIDQEKDTVLRKGKLKRRDVLLTTRGTIGNIAIYDETVTYDEIRINSGMIILRPNETKVLAEYLFEVLRSRFVKEQIDKKTSGAAQPQLPIKTLVTISFPVPKSLEAQKELTQWLKRLEIKAISLKANYQSKLTDLDELRKSLLQKAFAGELT